MNALFVRGLLAPGQYRRLARREGCAIKSLYAIRLGRNCESPGRRFHRRIASASYQLSKDRELPFVVIGGGSNLVVADAGYPGVVLRYTAKKSLFTGTCVTADAGADLQALVD